MRKIPRWVWILIAALVIGIVARFYKKTRKVEA